MKTVRKQFTDAKGRKITVTYWTLTGNRPGPTMTVVAGQHGMEHSGPCLLPELAAEIDRMDFAGTIHICPCANPAALALDYEIYPEKEDLSKIDDYYYSYFRHYYCPWGLGRGEAATMYNMNRTWNRSGSGVAFDITDWLWSEIVDPALLTVDMHCAQNHQPFIFNDFPKNNPLIGFSGIESSIECFQTPDEYNAGNLNYQASSRKGRYAFCIEFSIQHGLKEHEYAAGKTAVKNLMAALGMRKDEVVLQRPVWSIPQDRSGTSWKAEHTGHVRYFFKTCDEVKAGDKVFEIRDFQTLEVLQSGIAPHDGICYGISLHPIAKPGLPLCSVVKAGKIAEAGVPLAPIEL